MLGCSTQMPPVTAPLALKLLINIMGMPRSVTRCGHQVRDIKHGAFTPLVFSSTGGMGCEATVFYRCLADLLATH